jgi:hypothetical protein
VTTHAELNAIATAATIATTRPSSCSRRARHVYRCPRVWNLAAQNMPYLVDQTSSGQQVQQLVHSIAGVRWQYTPDVLPSLHRQLRYPGRAGGLWLRMIFPVGLVT